MAREPTLERAGYRQGLSLDFESKERHALPVKSRISSKGQVTVPAAVRDVLGLVAGTAVEFLVREGEVVLRKGRGGADPVDRVFGKLRLDRPVDTLLDEMRGPREERARGRGDTTGRRRTRKR